MAFNLIKFLESIFPFLFSALKRSWDNLTPAQQQALVNSGTIGQYLKNNLTALGDDLASLISNDLNIPKDTVEATLIALAAKFGLDTTSVNDAVAFLQKKLQSVSSNEEWNGLLSTILNVGATILSGGAIDWVHVALGLGEWVYQQFIAPKQVVVLQTPVAALNAIGASASVGQQAVPQPAQA
jgi:hypothetical protein